MKKFKIKKKLLSMAIVLSMGATFLTPIKAYATTGTNVIFTGDNPQAHSNGSVANGPVQLITIDDGSGNVLQVEGDQTQSIELDTYSNYVETAPTGMSGNYFKTCNSVNNITFSLQNGGAFDFNGFQLKDLVGLATPQSAYYYYIKPDGDSNKGSLWCFNAYESVNIDLSGNNNFKNVHSVTLECFGNVGALTMFDCEFDNIDLTVAPPATTASAANNSVSLNYSSITAGNPVTLTAVGDRQSATGNVVGDERYIPTTWTSDETGKSGTFTLNSGNYTSNYTTSTAGSYTITATYQKQTWDGTQWNDVSGVTDTKTTSLTVNAPLPTQAANEGNSVSVSPSSVTAGGSVTLTAIGDRQSASGSIVGDERYIPTTWTSTETGKSGTFTLNSGNYTSNYMTSTAGNYTITATFKLQSWDGTQWVDVSGATPGATDTETTSLTVNAPSTTANAGNNIISLSPISVTAGSPVTITAVGDRQSARDITVGNVAGDECYIPVQWSSDDGTTGSFNFNGGSYTASYIPSITGRHIITVGFQLYYWNDHSGQWEGYESGDAKTTILAVNASAPSAVTVEDVNSLDDITVANGTKKSNIGLPETVDVTLSNGTTSAAVTWDNGSPAYDGNTVRTYRFTGTLTLPDGVVNSNNYTASINVIVQASGETPPAGNNETTPAAVRIEGTKNVGDTLTAQLKDGDGNNYTTSAAVTYEWYRLVNSDSEFSNEIGTGRNYRLTGSDLKKYIGVRVTYGDYSFEYVIGKILAASSSSSHHHHSTPISIVANTNTNTNVNTDTNTNTNTDTKKSDDNNIKKTGWTDDTNNTKYYLKDDGSKTKGWKLIDNKWYFFNNRTGAMVRGWYKSELGDWTYDKTDTLGQWFHLDADGKLTTGWYKNTDGNWYYLCDGSDYGALGVMETGWKYINRKWYYLNANGVMASNTVVEGYTLGSDGALVE